MSITRAKSFIYSYLTGNFICKSEECQSVNAKLLEKCIMKTNIIREYELSIEDIKNALADYIQESENVEVDINTSNMNLTMIYKQKELPDIYGVSESVFSGFRVTV